MLSSASRGLIDTDFDGDGDAAEGIYFEIWDTLVPSLLARIQSYAFDVIGTRIAYDPDTHPYFFKDNNGNGIVDPEEPLAKLYSQHEPKMRGRVLT